MLSEKNQSLLKLFLINEISQNVIKQLLVSNPNPESLFTKDYQTLVQKDKIPEKIVQLIQTSKFNNSLDQEIELIEKNNLKIVTILDQNFPQALKELADAPVILYYQGEEINDDLLHIAFVGSRKATFYGKKHTKRIVNELSYILPNSVVVSGLAYGIDTVAHQSALQSGIKTIAVLAGGLPNIYPKENFELAQKILENGGTLICERPVNAQPIAKYFPRRNRIISGLSHAIAVMEAGEKSGALITIKYGLNQNKEIFALPGPVDNFNYIGSNLIIQNSSAKLLINAVDIVNDFVVNSKTQSNQQIEKFSQKNKEKNANIHLEDVEKKIVEMISMHDCNADIIADKLGLPIAKVLSVLVKMELKGILVHTNDDQYSIL